MSARLAEAELAQTLGRLPGWQLEEGKLVRTFRFRDFADAFAFMSACALRIHALDHHPEWSNVYSTVRVALVTHDAGGVTARDAELAAVMSAIAERFARA